MQSSSSSTRERRRSSDSSSRARSSCRGRADASNPGYKGTPPASRITRLVAAEGTRVRVHGRRRRSTAARTIVLRLLAGAALVAACGVAVGVGFAGSPEKLAAGVRIQGVDVGGMTPDEAREALAGRARRLRHTPVTFTVGSRTWTIAPSELGVEADWGAAVDAARRQGDGFAPVRGFRRIGVRVFGADVAPPTRVWDQALSYELRRLQREIDHPHVDAAVR